MLLSLLLLTSLLFSHGFQNLQNNNAWGPARHNREAIMQELNLFVFKCKVSFACWSSYGPHQKPVSSPCLFSQI